MVALTPASRALAEAEPTPLWPDRTRGPGLRAPLPGSTSADLVVVGAGLTGLWAAVLAKQQEPGSDVLVLEGDRAGAGGSARSGGFLSESVAHGLVHAAARWPQELDSLVELGSRNLREIRAFCTREEVDADLVLCGRTAVATEPHHVGQLRDEADLHQRHGFRATFQGAGGVRADVASPTYRAGLRLPDSGGLVDPAKLTWGLAEVAERLGVRLHERSPVRGLRPERAGVLLKCPQGTVRAGRVVLATSAFPVPLRRLRRYVLPLWDYVLATEPLSASEWETLGWRDGQGITDGHNLFHYYRPTPDGRILWGGGDPVYYFGGRTAAHLGNSTESHRRLAEDFFATFPQLEGVRFTHRWGGPIDTTARATPLFGTGCGGRLAYSVGFTGLGVAASRFGAQVALDLLAGRETAGSPMVHSRPTPFPPEPVRWPLVRLTQRALARADARQGERGWWLRLLDRRGLGLGI